jgi:hypothetical protein
VREPRRRTDRGGTRVARKLVAASALVVVWVVAVPGCAPPRLVSPLAAPTPAPDGPAGYAGLDLGYDLSYPQCKQGDRPLAGARFSIVGLNNGRAYTTNPCFERQWAKALRPRSIYVNSGYYPPNLLRTTTACRIAAQRRLPSADTAHRDAYAIGCGEAEHALAVADHAGGQGAAMWWIDVEASNSWDENDIELNRNSLLGQLERLDRAGVAIGLYSSFRDWTEVMGGWQPPWVRANWLPARSVAQTCAGPGFSGVPVWLVQEPDPAPDPTLDIDHVC